MSNAYLTDIEDLFRESYSDNCPDRIEIIFSNNKNKQLISSNVEELVLEDFKLFSSGEDFVLCFDKDFKKVEDYNGVLDGIPVRVLMYERCV